MAQRGILSTLPAGGLSSLGCDFGGWPSFAFCMPHHARGRPSLRGFRRLGTTDLSAKRFLPRSSKDAAKSLDFDSTNAQLCDTGKAGAAYFVLVSGEKRTE